MAGYEKFNCFSQSVYVGYTATPFANIFIYPDDGSRDGSEYGEDLYPRSFIVNLHAPSNYIGPEKVFGLMMTGLLEQRNRNRFH